MRSARVKFEGEGQYHICCKLACTKGEYPFQNKEGAAQRWVDTLRFYAEAYGCEVLAYVVMGNHYHLVVKFGAEEELPKSELLERAKLFYPNTWGQTEHWSDEQWLKFNKRIFNVSEFMRSLQSSYAKWYNQEFNRKGSLWAERFKSTLLLTDQALVDAIHYVELNPVRAGVLDEKGPETHVYSSLHARVQGWGKWLARLAPLYGCRSEREALQMHLEAVYHRGMVKSKENQMELSEETFEKLEARNFCIGMTLEMKERSFSDGIALGDEAAINEWITQLRGNGFYKRRIKAVKIASHQSFALREQRKNYVNI